MNAALGVTQSLSGQAWRWRRPQGDEKLGTALLDELLLGRGVSEAELDRYRNHTLRDLLARLDRIGQPRGGAVHVAEARGVGHEATDRRRAVRVERFGRAAAGEQQFGDQIAARHAPVARVRGPRAPPPRLTENGG